MRRSIGNCAGDELSRVLLEVDEVARLQIILRRDAGVDFQHEVGWLIPAIPGTIAGLPRNLTGVRLMFVDGSSLAQPVSKVQLATTIHPARIAIGPSPGAG